MAINVSAVSGNLARDAELSSTAAGTAVLEFTVVVNDRVKGKDGEWKDYPNYIDVSWFGKRAEGAAPYMMKGTKAFVTGKLRYSSWEKDGQKRSKLKLIAEEVEFHNRAQSVRDEEEPFDADIPF